MTETIPQQRTEEAADQTDDAAAPALSSKQGASAGLLVLAPLRLEANAVRRGLTQPSSRVMHTGLGATRARKSAGKSQPHPFGAMIVMGTAAGLSDDLTPGDLVVASEVTDGETTITLPGADLLAAELRRAGLNARAGRVIQVKKIVSSSERTRLAADGYLAADMESAAIVAAVKGQAPAAQQLAESAGLNAVDAAALAAASAGRPVAIIRAVSDGGFGPGMVTGGMSALRSLRAAAPVAERWGAARREPTGPP